MCSRIKYILATWCEELTHLKTPNAWKDPPLLLRAGGEGDDRGWDGWMASLTQWTWVWVNFKSWWWTGRPGMLQSMGLQRVRHDWATELNWELYIELPFRHFRYSSDSISKFGISGFLFLTWDTSTVLSCCGTDTDIVGLTFILLATSFFTCILCHKWYY